MALQASKQFKEEVDFSAASSLGDGGDVGDMGDGGDRGDGGDGGLVDVGVKVSQELSSCGRVSRENCLAKLTHMRVECNI